MFFAPVLGYVPRRVFSRDEAEAMLPHVRATLRTLRSLRQGLEEAEELVRDAESYYGEAVDTEANPERATFRRHCAQRDAVRDGFAESLRGFADEGVELKDLDRGLVDFPHRRDGAVVYLCWVEGEAGIGHWHPLETGFAGRQALPDGPTAGL